MMEAPHVYSTVYTSFHKNELCIELDQIWFSTYIIVKRQHCNIIAAKRPRKLTRKATVLPCHFRRQPEFVL